MWVGGVRTKKVFQGAWLFDYNSLSLIDLDPYSSMQDRHHQDFSFVVWKGLDHNPPQDPRA
jgi:hypothetical protein